MPRLAPPETAFDSDEHLRHIRHIVSNPILNVIDVLGVLLARLNRYTPSALELFPYPKLRLGATLLRAGGPASLD